MGDCVTCKAKERAFPFQAAPRNTYHEYFWLSGVVKCLLKAALPSCVVRSLEWQVIKVAINKYSSEWLGVLTGAQLTLACGAIKRK